jgi:phenylalanyl-tRNA synthetase beta chain
LRQLGRVKDALIGRGWQEAVTLSFVEPRIQNLLTPHLTQIPLDNPIAEQLSVMRTTLWPGLIPAWLYNRDHQQKRVRLFETGVCFHDVDGKIVETMRIGGLAAGAALPEQWGQPARAVDFYDVKADVVALFGDADEYLFEAVAHPGLHPGQCAHITRNGLHAGWIGALHPQVVKLLDLPEAPYVFELDWPVIREATVPKPIALSEFPSSRRDLAVVVAEGISAQQISECILQAGGNLLQKVVVFDIYRGKPLRDACKSVALGLIFNDYSRTLTVEDIDAAVLAITQALTRDLSAAIRQ